jgi:hypothetical protein
MEKLCTNKNHSYKHIYRKIINYTPTWSLQDSTPTWSLQDSTRTPVSSTNKTDRHDITEILLRVALNTINQTTKPKPFNL